MTVNSDQFESTLMFKEINEEPGTILNTYKNVKDSIKEATQILKTSKMVFIVGSGTSYHAGIVLQIGLLRRGIPAVAVRAPEFSHYMSEDPDGICAVLISQSGESREVLQSLELCIMKRINTIAVTNNGESPLAKKSTYSLITDAGKEESLAATKSHVAQLVVNYMLINNLSTNKNESSEIDNIQILAKMVEEILGQKELFKQISTNLIGRLVFLGNGLLHATAMEGALKFEETANLVTEAFPMGEYFHGPIQVLKYNDSVIIMKGDEKFEFERIRSRVKEYTKNILVIGSDENCDIIIPKSVTDMFYPILYVIPLQMLANFKTILTGLSPDKPTRLNKIVR
jgi:glucosamine--fructose-6-phosphate aminotransferase (isomerizing)